MEVNGQLHYLVSLPLGEELVILTGWEARPTPKFVQMLWRRKHFPAPVEN
jgi:hypothetical protein